MNVVAAVVGLVGTVVVALYFHRKGPPRPRPRYIITGNAVVGGEGPIEVLYEGRAVPRVTRTLVALWNGGSASMRREDVRELFSVGVPEGDILSFGILAVTRPQIGAEARRTGSNVAALKYSHLDEGDGAVLELLHTGRDAFDVVVNSVVIGVRDGPERIHSPLWDDPLGPWLGLFSGALLVIPGAMLVVTSPWVGWGLVLAGPIVGARRFHVARSRDVRRLPKGLRSVRYPPVPLDQALEASGSGHDAA